KLGQHGPHVIDTVVSEPEAPAGKTRIPPSARLWTFVQKQHFRSHLLSSEGGRQSGISRPDNNHVIVWSSHWRISYKKIIRFPYDLNNLNGLNVLNSRTGAPQPET